MVIAPVSLIFFSVPVNSSPLAWPAQNAAATARPIIRRRFIRALSSLELLRQRLQNSGRNRVASGGYMTQGLMQMAGPPHEPGDLTSPYKNQDPGNPKASRTRSSAPR